MTNDYKETLLKYMTGKLENETGVNEPQFNKRNDINQNIISYLDEHLTDGWYYVGDIQDSNSEYIVTYGWAGWTSEFRITGFIYITTKNMEPIALLTEYDNGTPFQQIEQLAIDEEGYFYGVDNNNGTFRFIMLNKIIKNGISTGNFKITLRTSYNLPSNITIDGNYERYPIYGFITKKVGEAQYFIFMEKVQHALDVCISMVSLTINVGSANEWKVVDTNRYLEPLSFENIYNDDFSILVGCREYGGSGNYYEYMYTFSDTPTFTLTNNFQDPTNGNGYLLDGVIVNNLKSYVSYNWFSDGIGYVGFYKINYDTTTLDLIYTFNLDEVSEIHLSFINSNGNVFFKVGYIYTEMGSSILASKIGMIYKNNISYVDVDTELYVSSSYVSKFYVKNIFNLYEIYVPNVSQETTKKIQLIFNSNNYNGLPYKALNSLIPNSGILYDNDDVIFARNLYNKTVSGATTTSTVQIPNTLLNDTTIAKSDLIGQTNLELVNDATPITKNIYETVDLNFSNTLIIRNDNDENNKILNPIGSSRLNNSISQTIDYDNAQATKLRVNYADGTNEIVELGNSQITILTNTTARYSFSIYVQKEIDNIQIISFDENTVYQIINNLNLTTRKTYNITQNVEVL